ncbi:hypothetical protein BDB00DRAFT_236869 [Zychaea mexicana]|uniref:uncharacterized protein n=1 Tax=Zychaea mexicana TaxID=64656 RepID=UPI0022FDCB6A|nr:uncharacterized protein BDB00DRAFT_236869 [Zychaea mexicana]KAI9495526.1 hypothetical protein BDB00DRAFT_236869 [Zychaea mexicana]
MNLPSTQHSPNTPLNSPSQSSAADGSSTQPSPFVVPSAPPFFSAGPQQQQQQASSSLYPTIPPSPEPQYYQQYQQQQHHHYQSQNSTPPLPQQATIRYQYHSINVPPHRQPPQHPQYYQGGSVIRRRIPDPSERGFPIAALFFLFGWFCPPLWVLGACCCSGSRNRYEAWWGKANFIMAVMFIISSIVYSMIAITVGDWMVGMRLLSFSVE